VVLTKREKKKREKRERIWISGSREKKRGKYRDPGLDPKEKGKSFED